MSVTFAINGCLNILLDLLLIIFGAFVLFSILPRYKPADTTKRITVNDANLTSQRGQSCGPGLSRHSSDRSWDKDFVTRSSSPETEGSFVMVSPAIQKLPDPAANDINFNRVKASSPDESIGGDLAQKGWDYQGASLKKRRLKWNCIIMQRRDTGVPTDHSTNSPKHVQVS